MNTHKVFEQIPIEIFYIWIRKMYDTCISKPNNCEWAKAILAEAYGSKFVPDDEFWEKTMDGEYDDNLFLSVLRFVDWLKKNLEISARDWFKDWQIPMENYIFSIIWTDVTVDIFFTNVNTGANLCLNEVYYRETTGEILQAHMSF